MWTHARLTKNKSSLWSPRLMAFLFLSYSGILLWQNGFPINVHRRHTYKAKETLISYGRGVDKMPHFVLVQCGKSVGVSICLVIVLWQFLWGLSNHFRCMRLSHQKSSVRKLLSSIHPLVWQTWELFSVSCILLQTTSVFRFPSFCDTMADFEMSWLRRVRFALSYTHNYYLSSDRCNVQLYSKAELVMLAVSFSSFDSRSLKILDLRSLTE